MLGEFSPPTRKVVWLLDIIQEIFAKAKSISREYMTEKDEEVLLNMCDPAYEELCSRLKPQVSKEAIHHHLVGACAALALSFYVGLNLESVEEMTAGNIRVRKRTSEATKENAACLRRQAELMLTGWLDDRGFYFRTVMS